MTSWDQFEFLPGALEAIRILTDAGLPVAVITNQRGIARGRMTEEDLADIHRRMVDELEAAGGGIDAIYHCPHEEGTCDCRKPEVGMLLRASADLNVDLQRAALVGDGAGDMEAARRAGCTSVLVAPRGAEEGPAADLVVPSLREAARALTGSRR